MPLLTLDDVVEKLADQVGIYVASSIHSEDCACRVCWTSQIKQEILAAVEVDRAMTEYLEARR